jgi:hypothetical protein
MLEAGIYRLAFCTPLKNPKMVFVMKKVGVTRGAPVAGRAATPWYLHAQRDSLPLVTQVFLSMTSYIIPGCTRCALSASRLEGGMS